MFLNSSQSLLGLNVPPFFQWMLEQFKYAFLSGCGTYKLLLNCLDYYQTDLRILANIFSSCTYWKALNSPSDRSYLIIHGHLFHGCTQGAEEGGCSPWRIDFSKKRLFFGKKLVFLGKTWNLSPWILYFHFPPSKSSPGYALDLFTLTPPICNYL